MCALVQLAAIIYTAHESRPHRTTSGKLLMWRKIPSSSEAHQLPAGDSPVVEAPAFRVS